MAQKEEYHRLLDPGVHRMDLDELNRIAVEGHDSRRREYLFGRLVQYINEFSSLGVKAEFWVDGSFLTRKPDPADVDLVIIFCPYSARALPLHLQEAMMRITENKTTKARLDLDVYTTPFDNKVKVAYWRDHFGTYRDEITPKGFAVIGECR